MNKIRTKDIKSIRDQAIIDQNNKCKLCNIEFNQDDIVHLDHRHSDGVIRGSIHLSCNYILGKLENACNRFNVDINLILDNISDYINTNHTELIHPTYFTPEERKERNKIKAKKRRNKSKEIK